MGELIWAREQDGMSESQDGYKLLGKVTHAGGALLSDFDRSAYYFGMRCDACNYMGDWEGYSQSTPIAWSTALSKGIHCQRCSTLAVDGLTPPRLAVVLP